MVDPWTALLPLALAVAAHHNGEGLVFVVGSVAGEEADVDLDAPAPSTFRWLCRREGGSIDLMHQRPLEGGDATSTHWRHRSRCGRTGRLRGGGGRRGGVAAVSVEEKG